MPARLAALALSSALLLDPIGLSAASDKATGTFAVKGKTTTFKHVYVTSGKDRFDPERSYIVILLSDVSIAEGDRTPDRLLELSKSGAIHALRVIWATGFDSVSAVPYHAAISDSGRRAAEAPTIDLRKLNDSALDVGIRSKMLGQDWHFNATASAAIQQVDTIELEPLAGDRLVERHPGQMPVERSDAALQGDATAMKRALGQLGYVANDEQFVRAVTAGNLDAVKLFLKLGMSANAKDELGHHVMVLAAMSCAREPTETRTPIVQALLAAKGHVNATDDNKATPLIWAVQSCDRAFIEALIKAGANVNARAAGGGTPLILADALGKTEIAQLLRKAGAK